MVFYEFSLVISCILFRSHAKNRQRILSFNLWINASFVTSLYENIGVPYRPEKDVTSYQRVSVNGVHNPICLSSHEKFVTTGHA
jgi:hypothetical protein